MKQHHRYIIVLVCLGIIACAAIGFVYQTQFDGTLIDPVVIHTMDAAKTELPPTGTFSPDGSDVQQSYQVKTDKTAYHPGDDVYGTFNICIKRNIAPVVQWTFVDDIAQALAPRQGNLMVPGCYTDVRVLIATVPDGFRAAYPASEYLLYGIVTYQVNPMRKISYTFITNKFTIIQK